MALECLASPSDWVEYHAALCMCALRTLDWPTVTASAKRLLFVAAALALIKTQQATAGKSDDVTQVITDTGSQEGYESTV
ncbi:MAG: hypothetical protein M5R40_26600 [Anaerolineae bacterium]|nr:hypothetical protein [Anaerolineae bacterium]